MKFFHSIILLILGFLLINSCSPKPEGIPVIKGTNVAGEELLLSEIASSTIEIPLETREGIYVQGPSSITKSDEHIYLLDLDRILKFRLDGTYVGEIARKGEAPGEYLGAQGISYDKKSKSIVVAAHFNQALFKYSEEGTLIDKVHFSFPFYVNASDNGIWVLSHGGFINSRNAGFMDVMGYRLNKDFVITDSLLVKRVPISGNEGMGRYILQQHISSFDHKPGIHYAVIMNEDFLRDTLYHLQKDGLKPYSRFDFNFTDQRKVTYILEITGQGNFYFITYMSYLSDKLQQSMFVYDKKMDAGYDLKNGVTAEDGNTYFLNAFGDGDYFYIKRETDETGFELNPIIVWIKLKE